MVHRDVKPENIMLSADGTAKLLDMGFAKTLGSGEMAKEEIKELTLVGTALGSPAYMAPEQVTDSSRADVVTDIYSLGASCYHALTGRLPYDGKSAMQVMEKVLHEPLVPPHEVEPSVPAGVGAMVCYMMEKEMKRRPPDGATVERLLAEVNRHPDDARRVLRVAATGRRRLLVTIVVLALVAAGAGLAWHYGWR